MDPHRSASSSSSSASHGRVGTPLAYTPESGAIERRIRGRQGQGQGFVPVWKQEVTDEQGRKRLHGAFKGGFSAGYYNTVGSKEGWQPSTFESSRSTRSERKTMRPEDFMDEEDLQEALDGKQLRAVQHKRGAEPTRDPRTQRTQPEDLLGLLVPTAQSESAESPGHRLLRRLGFRSSASATPVAPAPAFIPPTKRDRHGLGFHLSAHASIIRPPSEPSSSSSSRKRAPLGIRGGIGVGILNEDDMDEDVAVYSDQEDDIDGGRGALPRLSKKLPTGPGSRAYDIPIGATDVCSDGMRAIPGFIVCARGVVLGVPAATVAVPEGWKPNPPIAKLPPPGPSVPVPPLPAGMTFPPMPPLPLAGFPPMPQLPPGFPIPPPPPLPTGMPSLPIPPPPPLPFMASAAPPRPKIKTVAKDIAQAALNAPHKPFTGDKRDRFLAYCEYCAGNSAEPPFLSDADQSEFASTASLFRPMSAMLEARFTRAHVQVGDATPAAGAAGAAPTTAPTSPDNAAESAAAMNMFGAMTRTTTDFFPTRLVCKRFGVPPPHGKHNAGGSSGPGRGGGGGDADPEVDEHLNEATMQSILDGARGANPFKLDPRSTVAADAPAAGHAAWIDPLASMPRPPQEVFDKIFGDAVARLAQCALGPALDAEDMPQVEVGEGHIAADAVARVLAMHQLADAGIAVPAALRASSARDGKAEAGGYERVDERDAVEGTAVASFKPRLFKRKRAAEVDHEVDDGAKGTGGEVKKGKKKKVGARTTTLSFGDDL